MTYVSLVQTARSVAELDSMVWQMSVDGYRIVSVLRNDVGDYVIVGQKPRETEKGQDGVTVRYNLY